MLKIDIIRFEAQDVITTSVPIPKCKCDESCFPNGVFDLKTHEDRVKNISCFCYEDQHSLGK